MYSLGPLGSGCPFPALPGLPGSSTDLSLRAVPNHPGRSDGCLLIASPPISGFILFGRLATPIKRHEAESGSLTLRLAGLLSRFPPAGLLRLAPVPLHARMSNLHGELLSIHKISQAWPGIPKRRKVSQVFLASLADFARYIAYELTGGAGHTVVKRDCRHPTPSWSHAKPAKLAKKTGLPATLI
jgi:hypothetical protein